MDELPVTGTDGGLRPLSLFTVGLVVTALGGVLIALTRRRNADG